MVSSLHASLATALVGVSDDGVSARYACCDTCASYDCSTETKQPIFFQAGDSVTWDTCEKTCSKKALAMPCITSKNDNKRLQTVSDDAVWLGYTTRGKDPKILSNWYGLISNCLAT